MLTRWYDPGEGQFTSRDAVGLSPVPASISANRFAYVNDNPFAGTDPTGDCSWWDVVCGARAVAHAASSAYHSATNFVSHSWTATKHVVHHVAHKIKQAAHHVYHAARKAVHHVVHTVKRYVHHVVHKIRDGYHRVRHYVSHTWHRVKQVASHVYHKVKHAVKRAVHHVSSAVHKTIGAAKHAIHKAAHKIAKAGTWVKHKAAQAQKAVKQAAKATGNFLAKHAATITSIVVSVVVFAGCEAVVSVATAGVGSAPGAILCGAIAGAAGSMAGAAVKAHQEGRDVTGAELGQAAIVGGIGGALGGAAGPLVGKAISAVGGKLAAPVANTIARTAGSAERSLTSSASAGERTAVRDVVEDAGEFCLRRAHLFSPDTRIVRADGTLIAISRLRVGDKVRSRDIKTGRVTSGIITAVLVNHDSDLLDLTVIGRGRRSTIHTTAQHLFWSESRRRWVRADQLNVTDRLASDNARISKVMATPGDGDRWDLTVASTHDYFVVAGKADVLVHNCEDSFTPPKISLTRHGQLTNGTHTIDSAGMAQHLTGSGSSGKSQFLFGVDAERAVLDAASYADEGGLWVGNKAKVPVVNGPVGILGRTGELTHQVTVARTRTGLVQGWPSGG